MRFQRDASLEMVNAFNHFQMIINLFVHSFHKSCASVRPLDAASVVVVFMKNGVDDAQILQTKAATKQWRLLRLFQKRSCSSSIGGCYDVSAREM